MFPEVIVIDDTDDEAEKRRRNTIPIRKPRRSLALRYYRPDTTFDDDEHKLPEVKRARLEAVAAGMSAARAVDAACGDTKATSADAESIYLRPLFVKDRLRVRLADGRYVWPHHLQVEEAEKDRMVPPEHSFLSLAQAEKAIRDYATRPACSAAVVTAMTAQEGEEEKTAPAPTRVTPEEAVNVATPAALSCEEQKPAAARGEKKKAATPAAALGEKNVATAGAPHCEEKKATTPEAPSCGEKMAATALELSWEEKKVASDEEEKATSPAALNCEEKNGATPAPRSQERMVIVQATLRSKKKARALPAPPRVKKKSVAVPPPQERAVPPPQERVQPHGTTGEPDRSAAATIVVNSAGVEPSMQARRHPLTPAPWPRGVVHLRAQYNPSGIRFAYAPSFGYCSCDPAPCRHHTCMNGSLGVFCAPNCCTFEGACGNSLTESPSVALANRGDGSGLTLVATRCIDEGVIIGEYLGKMTLETASEYERPANQGYRMAMLQRPEESGRLRVCIDAQRYGSMMRFMNHSCAPAAKFCEASNGHKHTVIAVTLRDVDVGEEITVDYGDDLWFQCLCGEATCRHRSM